MDPTEWSERDLPVSGRGWEAFVAAERTEDPDGRVHVRPPRYDDLPPRPALLFPAGVGYRAAIAAYYDAREAGLAVPPHAELVAPLPHRTVALLRPDGRWALDPAAPLGFAQDDGRVVSPSFTIPADMPDADVREAFAAQRRLGLALPPGATLLTGPVPREQVLLPEGAVLDGPDAVIELS